MTSQKYHGTLELNWVNKDKSLYYEYDKDGNPGKPIWVEKDDIKVLEPRILKLVKEYGDTSKLTDPLDNALIRGDNLLALRTLVEMFKEREEKDKVKCVYLDPPYNTGNAFEHYEDNLEHSEWLTLMRDRLILIKKIMRKDGVLFVSIDDAHLYSLGAMLDEIFPNKIDRGMIIWNNAGSTKGYRNIVKNHEYILARTINSDNRNINYFGQNHPGELGQVSDRLYIKIQKKNPVGRVIFKKGTRIERTDEITFKKEIGDKIKIKIISDKMHFKEGKLQNDVELEFACPYMKQIPLYYKNLELGVPTYDQKGQEITELYFNSSGLPWYIKNRNTIVLSSIPENLPNSASDEQEKIFGKGKGFEYAKPEELISLLFDFFTKENDLVLDSFLGSGTTAAVANKMNRRWIGVEIGKHMDSHCIPRLNGVILGKDTWGISQKVNWEGGGGFRYYKLGNSLLSDSKINWDLNYEDIARALFMNFDYRFKEKVENDIFLGQSGNTLALCVVDKEAKVLQKVEIEKLLEKIKLTKSRNLVIFTNNGIAIKNSDLPDNIKIRKIPESILNKYKL